jgi:hypothetical protein
MRVKYIGPDIGVDGLLNAHEYEVIEIDKLSGALRIIDESGEDYLYSPKHPKPISSGQKAGHFEIVEDDENNSLAKSILE